ncbi:MAG: FdtA/QdtA family cupin domain-containing protein [Candidatus Heimdallarchaeota archaeon]|nr:FdtA/QdtA family cupin domain-containing protein [Candidatus Heimdallarchaeota archaeon]
MAKIISIPSFSDQRGTLSVIDKLIPFEIKRLYYIYNTTNQQRGGHRHKKTKQAAISINGSCSFYVNNNKVEETFVLDSPDICLLLEPEDWHTMQDFSKDCILLVLASEHYDVNDYIDEEY